MKILRADFKKGFVTIRVNVNDDLWYLHGIIEPGDLVKAKTLRSLFLLREGRREKVGKKPMILTISVEKIEFEKHGDRLRLTGKIVEGPEEVQTGSYHTIEVSMDSIITIYKGEWKSYHKKKIEKARVKVPDVLIVVTDMNQATFGLMRRSGIQVVTELRNPHSVHEENKLSEFYKRVASEIGKRSKETERIILAGPGFAKEHVRDIIEEKFPGMRKKLIMSSASSATRTGINEILKRGVLDRVVKESEIVKESKVVQEFFTHLRKDDGLVAYGLEQVKKADDAGAVKTLIVSEERIREDEVDQLASRVERKKGRVEIVSRTHELGEQFYRMGGLGAILRFKIC